MQATNDIHVSALIPLIPPRQLREQFPMSETANKVVVQGRETIRRILNRQDERMLVVVGPCSIHDEAAALDYAARLKAVAQEVEDRLFIVMRVYFEKPRTTIGWKGFINDPRMDGSFDIAEGLTKSRHLLLQINEMGLPAAGEVLDPITPQYIADLMTWASLGARTTESQTHRQMASGLSMPIGYKNGTDGGLEVAINAMKAALHQHSFLGIDADGRTCIVQTTGNPWGHLILRGGRNRPNYCKEFVDAASISLQLNKLAPNIVVDCSHDNSSKEYQRQAMVWRNVVEQRIEGNNNIVGLMLESYLGEGRQDMPDELHKLAYGVSITDACIGWELTEQLLREAADSLRRGSVQSSAV